jgi:5'-nucleotidase
VRILVTNDDGIDSPGLMVLAAAARELGFEVTVAAPSWNSSGASGALTAVQQDGKVVMEDREVKELGNSPVYSVQAAPAYIARAAVRGAFGEPPDVVLSGVNAGANTGQAVLHSGTVCAALTAFTHGASAMAISIDSHDPQHWETAAHVAKPLIRWIADLDQSIVLNVNLPDRRVSELRELRQGTLAAFGAVQTHMTEITKGHVRTEFSELSADEEGTDACLLADGFTTVTALRAIGADSALDVSILG